MYFIENIFNFFYLLLLNIFYMIRFYPLCYIIYVTKLKNNDVIIICTNNK